MMTSPASCLAARPHFVESDLPGILADIERVLRSGRLILGEETAALEREFAARVGTRHAVAVSSCTAALEIALRAAGAPGREVIVPTNTFAATAAAVLRVGARAVLADCGPDGNFGAAEALTCLTAQTAAIVVVHVAGFPPPDLDLLQAECHRRDIALIEDCAHAHGAQIGARHVGSLGDAGCFSFYPTKILTCGVGGMLTTNRDDVAALGRSLRHHGQGASLEEIVAVGADYLLDEVRAVLCRAQLRRLDEVLAHRRAVARAYDAAIGEDPRIAPPRAAPGTVPAFYKYPVRLAGQDAAVVRQRMAAAGVETGPLYWPLVHQMPAFASLGARLPRSEAILRERLCLPMHALVGPADCAQIVETLRQCLDGGNTR